MRYTLFNRTDVWAAAVAALWVLALTCLPYTACTVAPSAKQSQPAPQQVGVDPNAAPASQPVQQVQQQQQGGVNTATNLQTYLPYGLVAIVGMVTAALWRASLSKDKLLSDALRTTADDETILAVLEILTRKQGALDATEEARPVRRRLRDFVDDYHSPTVDRTAEPPQAGTRPDGCADPQRRPQCPAAGGGAGDPTCSPCEGNLD